MRPRSTDSDSSPLSSMVGSRGVHVRAATPASASATALMCGGDEPQQPPAMLSMPSRAKSSK